MSIEEASPAGRVGLLAVFMFFIVVSAVAFAEGRHILGIAGILVSGSAAAWWWHHTAPAPTDTVTGE